jgi:integrase
MLRARDLLGLTVQDVRKRNRVMRDLVELDVCTTGQSVQCTLSNRTMDILEEWIDWSAKRPRDYLFTAQHGSSGAVISPRQLNRLVKIWAEGIGLEPSLYGTESLRRTRAMHVLNRTGSLEAARILLGLSDIRSTSLYLRDADPVDALAISRKYEI